MFSRDKDLNFLKQNVLNNMRNEFIYHVSEEPFIKVLELLNLPRLDLVASISSKYEDMYFQLSDDIVLNYITGRHSTEEKELEYLSEILKKIMHVTVHFIKFSRELTDEYIQWKHWKVEPRKQNP